jgi:hypothetical protein
VLAKYLTQQGRGAVGSGQRDSAAQQSDVALHNESAYILGVRPNAKAASTLKYASGRRCTPTAG